MAKFKLQSDFKPRGDQKKAIRKLVDGYSKYPQQTLLGVTGSGKTFTMANAISKINKPTLVLSHNKTLAAQLYNEFRSFFPENKVCYFVSYYDYYQPESYIPATDTYIEKDILVNEKIEQLRLEAASSLLSRDDVVIISSVSCIYGLGDPDEYSNASFKISKGQKISPKQLAESLIEIQYERNDIEVRSGNFRIKGDILEFRQGAGTTVLRIQFLGDEIEKIIELEPINYKKIKELDEILVFPAKHFMIPKDSLQRALKTIRKELDETLPKLGQVEAYRLQQRTNYDLEMLEEISYCKGIENYSRHFDNRLPGQPPSTLLDFFPKDFLFIIDESHVTLPQVHGMYGGDRTRKKNLIENGFRLPSAYDNRPLKFSEFEKYLNHVIYASATPSDYEIKNSGSVAEQIIRPTGLVDPPIEIKPAEGQIQDVVKEIGETIKKGYRVLVTTLTKRLAEDLTTYLVSENIKTQYLHSEIDTLERTKIINNLRLGKFDVLVGINLLREGLDIPEVALVAILDADKEGFLRNTRSLIQTIGRAARNSESKVVMYADVMTKSIKEAVKETERRRKKQMAYNKKHKITPKTIKKSVIEEEDMLTEELTSKELDKNKLIIKLESEMKLAAERLDFERAIELREKLKKLSK